MTETGFRCLRPVMLELAGTYPQWPRGRERNHLLSLVARQAVRLSAHISSLPAPEMRKSESGAPEPDGGVHWSLTHKPGVVAGVVDILPVGIDVEWVRPVSDRMIRKIASPKEWELIDGDPLTAFFRVWTGKEAVLKAFGIGLSGLSDCHVESGSQSEGMRIRYRDRICRVHHTFYDTAIVAVTATVDVKVEWIRFRGWEPCRSDFG